LQFFRLSALQNYEFQGCCSKTEVLEQPHLPKKWLDGLASPVYKSQFGWNEAEITAASTGIGVCFF
jgi:hypothetical protein